MVYNPPHDTLSNAAKVPKMIRFVEVWRSDKFVLKHLLALGHVRWVMFSVIYSSSGLLACLEQQEEDIE